MAWSLLFSRRFLHPSVGIVIRNGAQSGAVVRAIHGKLSMYRAALGHTLSRPLEAGRTWRGCRYRVGGEQVLACT